jgi:hypothetical protein
VRPRTAFGVALRIVPGIRWLEGASGPVCLARYSVEMLRRIQHLRIVLMVGIAPALLAAFSMEMRVGQCQQTKARVDRRIITPNRPAPELYADQLSLKITLVNLPGAKLRNSYWQAEYKIYFVPERDFEQIAKQLAKEGKTRDLKAEYFPTKLLLAEGTLNKRGLGSLPERTFTRKGIEFKGKIPTESQTSFSSILSFYTVKIYDAELKKTVYQSDVFIVPPFDTDSADKTSLSARTGIFLSFFVASDGSLYNSSRKVTSESSEWKPY